MDGIAVMAYPIGPGPVPANFAVVTKSGTNDYHGTAFWDYNSSALNARDFYSPAAPFRVYHNTISEPVSADRSEKTRPSSSEIRRDRAKRPT